MLQMNKSYRLLSLNICSPLSVKEGLQAWGVYSREFWIGVCRERS